MTDREKINLYKDPIIKLYSKEGRTKSYISRLFGLNRTLLTRIINNEWKLVKAQKTHLKPSTEKFLNRNRLFIKSKLDSDVTITSLVEILGCNKSLLETIINYDPILKKSNEDRFERIHKKHVDRINEYRLNSSRNYDPVSLPGEKWKNILGYPKYMISNMGRVKVYRIKTNSYILLTPSKNTKSGRLYISLVDSSGKKHNLNLARLVGYNFVLGFSDDKNTINHKDGNVENNNSSNLEWISQSDNRKPIKKNKSDFKKIIYKNKYEFKTLSALAKFLGKSETQTRKYLGNPGKYNLKIIK